MREGGILLVGSAGYVGSHLAAHLRSKGHTVVGCDQDLIPGHTQVHSRYQELSAKYLAQFSAVLWFAGHSNVGQCQADPAGALRNNCLDLIEFVSLISPSVPLIYASSASVYSTQGSTLSSESAPLMPALTPYDASKSSFDSVATNFFSNTTGLRMGTVSGWSESLRPDLVFNAMVLSALRDSEVRLANETARRSLLFLDDLVLIVEGLLTRKERLDSLPRILNCASVNTTMGQLANDIATSFDVKIALLPDSPTYDFALDCSRLRQLVNDLPVRSVVEEAQSFADRMER